MSIMCKVDLSKPVENFAEKRGEALFGWAWDTWVGFVRQVLEIIERDEVSDDNFVAICEKMCLASFHDSEGSNLTLLLNEARGIKHYGWVSEWLERKHLPGKETREEILRLLLEGLSKRIRGQRLHFFIRGMMLIAGEYDGRRTDSWQLVTPQNVHLRGIGRLSLSEPTVAILAEAGIKNLNDLVYFMRSPNKRDQPHVLYDKRLRALPGVTDEIVESVLQTVKSWDNPHLTPVSIRV